ncbi:hypothetical protein PFICI_08712 [Pestalotiopsis fici W106-1]|uniref:Ribosomal protein/NADH dehydrogenase domain-containing protein n=1 Tax=Pestalotiopsis fici (strain W106-1 / CGMCC3.15140) TaxID=1229662 RepID=W3WYK5_PESFW|nr:uncharacterized protein PFICI_08712 [Pestalotiopsis fici W106-1]ETS78859.1 hypothetical protein PFICI_08712 [Pestalotiopsis fici W106-1]
MVNPGKRMNILKAVKGNCFTPLRTLLEESSPILTHATAARLTAWPRCGNSPAGDYEDTHGFCDEVERRSPWTKVRPQFALAEIWQQPANVEVDRKFWKLCLPRLKFWNPAIPMLLNRHTNQSGPAVMSIYFRQSAAAAASRHHQLPLAQQPHSSTTNETPAPAPEEDERIVTIDMKNQHSDAILAEFLHKTGATQIHPTAEERSEMVQVEELKEKSAVDRAIVKKWFDAKRAEERMAARAKEEAEAIRLANQ